MLDEEAAALITEEEDRDHPDTLEAMQEDLILFTNEEKWDSRYGLDWDPQYQYGLVMIPLLMHVPHA